MAQEEKKISFFKKLFWGGSSTEKVSKISKKAVEDFDTWVSMIDSYIKEKNWKKAIKTIIQLKKVEKKNTAILLKNSSDDKKDAIKKLHLNKLESLLDYERNIENLIKKEKDDKILRIIDDKILYVKNRLDYYMKSENYKKANDTLTSFYEKYKNEQKVIDFYNERKKTFDVLLVPKKVELTKEKKWLFSFFWRKKTEDKINTNTLKDNKKDEDKKDTPALEVKEIEKEKLPEDKKVWFFWKVFWNKEEKPKVSNFDSAIRLIESLVVSKSYDKARTWLTQIKKKEEWAFSVLNDEWKKKHFAIYNNRITTIDNLLKKIENEEKFVQYELSEKKENIQGTEEKPEIKKEITWDKKEVISVSDNNIWESEILIEENKNVLNDLDNNNKVQKLDDNSLVEVIESNNEKGKWNFEEVEEVKKLWISELKNNNQQNSDQWESTDISEENKVIWNSVWIANKVQELENKVKNIETNKWDELVIKTDNKEEVKSFFSKFFNKDPKNLDKVANLMESLMNIKDIDKAISTVEAVKNVDWKNIVVKTDIWAQDVNINQSELNNNEWTKNNENNEKDNKVEQKSWELKVESKLFSWLLWDKEKEEKKIDVLEVKDYAWAIKWIKYFISTKDFKKAKAWIEEIKNKEQKAFNELYEKIDVDKEKKRQEDLYQKKIVEIEKLKEYLEDEEIKYNEKKEVEKFKLKFEQLKTKLDEQLWMKKYYEALDLITNFFEENKNSVAVINFYNKWKNVIQKKIKKQEEDQEKINARNARKEAEVLIWENLNVWNDNSNVKIVDWKKVELSLSKKILEKLNIYKKFNQKLKERKLLDEVTMLIESQNEVDEMAKKTRLENMHMWLIKELDNDRLLWYELYAKILWKDKISWDTFWFVEDTGTYKFFLWDATWHWVQAGLIVTLLTRLFYNFWKENFLEKLVFEVNNWLKQDLKSWNFITWIFFEVDKDNLNTVKYVWMWHEPMLIFRKDSNEVEKFVAWWLAAWIRVIEDINNIKTNIVKLNDWDIVFIYSDWVVESRNKNNELLWVEWFSNIIKRACLNFHEWKVIDLYWAIIEDIKAYKWWSVNFYDDATIFILKRNSQKDVIDKKSLYLKDLSMKEWLTKRNVRELEWKTKEEIEKELEKIRKQKQLNLIIWNLEKLYITWEVLKLKQEAIRYIKEWFIHKKINWYLKKAISNERQYKIDLKDQKMKSRYIVLKELMKKWDYSTVIRETQEIIASDGNITI